MVAKSALFQIIILFRYFLSCSCQDFIFNGFQNASNNMAMGYSAKITDCGMLQLTNDSYDLKGQAFFSSPIQLIKTQDNISRAVSFSTTFVFQIISKAGSQNGGGHGLTFAIAPSKQLPGAASGKYLGLLGPGNNGNFSNHVFAVELDTVNDFFNDTDEDHVGIDVDDLTSEILEIAAYYDSNSTKFQFELEDRGLIQAWLEYNGNNNVLNVTVAPLSVQKTKPSRPLISGTFNLTAILKEDMYVGFTAATGKLASSHHIMAWSFRTEGTARAIDLSKLPKFPDIRSNHHKVTIIKIVALSFAILSFMVILIVIFLYLWHRAKLSETIEDWELENPHRLNYRELYSATNGFSKTEVLGSGGFGNVYKGVMRQTGEVVAIKKISTSTRQGMREFIAEISSLGRMRHRNLVELRGWCKRNDDLIIVYEFMPNGSLDTLLFNHNKNAKTTLSWKQRLNILKGVASGLLYLHEEWEKVVVVHRDVKSSNVLLKSDLTPKLGDFGLARLYNRDTAPQTTCAAGTLGYMAPEMLQMGKATTSSDVYAFGVLLLEVVCGRRTIEPSAPDSERNLVRWVRECLVHGGLMEVVDPRMEEYDGQEVEMALKLGIMCCQYSAEVRPSMRQVNNYLNGTEQIVAGDLSLVSVDPDLMGSESTCSFSLSQGMISASSFHGGR
ncbi:receptor lectin kinase [Rhynchospora pubera]|uniref:non-specific serine/threonine protein kinase n=1 Tax=Rhynchospora pubera TaxID=906938 RepID=A0AAV8FVZ5_9POAL|nr:receptor lectin kinase [Rhynchospora pubera]